MDTLQISVRESFPPTLEPSQLKSYPLSNACLKKTFCPISSEWTRTPALLTRIVYYYVRPTITRRCDMRINQQWIIFIVKFFD